MSAAVLVTLVLSTLQHLLSAPFASIFYYFYSLYPFSMRIQIRRTVRPTYGPTNWSQKHYLLSALTNTAKTNISLEPDGTETPALACIEAHDIPDTFDNANRDDI